MQKLPIDLAWLQSSDHDIARMWRWSSAHGIATTEEIVKGSGGKAHTLRNLTSRGWMEVVKRQRIRPDEVTWVSFYQARTAQRPSNGNGEMKRRLTDLSMLSARARQSGLAQEMGAALKKIEIEAREIRDALARESKLR